MNSGEIISAAKIPLVFKLAYTLFAVVLVPIYLKEYGATNFLWFCDAALLLTLAGVWLENALLVSMCAVGILIPQTLWLVDFGVNFFGVHLTGLTDYMFDRRIPIFIRSLSLFHGWLPIVLVWLLSRLGYDWRGLPAWTALAVVLVLICYKFTPPSGAQLPNPETPLNINNIWGFNNYKPQAWLNQTLYVALWLVALFIGAYLPTHFILRKLFRSV